MNLNETEVALEEARAALEANNRGFVGLSRQDVEEMELKIILLQSKVDMFS